MKTINLFSVTVKPNEGVKVELKEGYEKCLAFYPVVKNAPLYTNVHFLDAQLAGRSLTCINNDDAYEHEIWIIQYNRPLPPIFQIEPWQILIVGELKPIHAGTAS
uniref:Uncharacterized protein n=1 Tax=viral metagenome TaxID=1070528 RepID=A0A6H1Z653_9ZZZZ